LAVPIESTFATVRHRTGKTKGCLSRKTGLAMAFRLMMSAQTKWRKLDGANRMPEFIEGVEFKDGIKQIQNTAFITPSPTFDGAVKRC
jgi:putative transposase